MESCEGIQNVIIRADMPRDAIAESLSEPIG
jgi:hypothetical protein